jgi:hypothetical protein
VVRSLTRLILPLYLIDFFVNYVRRKIILLIDVTSTLTTLINLPHPNHLLNMLLDLKHSLFSPTNLFLSHGILILELPPMCRMIAMPSLHIPLILDLTSYVWVMERPRDLSHWLWYFIHLLRPSNTSQYFTCTRSFKTLTKYQPITYWQCCLCRV